MRPDEVGQTGGRRHTVSHFLWFSSSTENSMGRRLVASSGSAIVNGGLVSRASAESPRNPIERGHVTHARSSIQWIPAGVPTSNTRVVRLIWDKIVVQKSVNRELSREGRFTPNFLGDQSSCRRRRGFESLALSTFMSGWSRSDQP